MQITTDLRPLLGPVRDQGLRPTCLAFALSAAHEVFHERQAPLSTEWLFYHAVKLAGDTPDAGLAPSFAAAVLSEPGQPDEKEWPYEKQAATYPWRPPKKIGQLFCAGAEIDSVQIDRVVARLNKGQPVVLCLLIDETMFSWTDCAGTAFITHQPPPFDPGSGHAVVAVGWGTNGSDRQILIRNSWGSEWGDHGHAWLSEAYTEERGQAAIPLKDHQ